MEGAYDEKCDIWAVGVITYVLFSQGEFPFDGPSEVKRGSFYLPPKRIPRRPSSSFDWTSQMSEPAKDFIRLLLRKDSIQRPSATQALKHPWLNFEK